MVTNSISDKATIGKNVKIWNFVYVGDNVEIGDNVKIGSLAHIDYDVKIGENTLIEGMVYIPPLSRIGKNVFIGPAAALTVRYSSCSLESSSNQFGLRHTDQWLLIRSHRLI